LAPALALTENVSSTPLDFSGQVAIVRAWFLGVVAPAIDLASTGLAAIRFAPLGRAGSEAHDVVVVGCDRSQHRASSASGGTSDPARRWHVLDREGSASNV
jgi:hypothetical protein